MKLYVASRASIPARSAMWRQFRDRICAKRGHQVFSSWIDEAGEGETDDWSELWARIANEIQSCEALIMYAEVGDLPLKGAFVEVGMALMAGLDVAVVLPSFANLKPIGSWLAHPAVRVLPTIQEALLDLEARGKISAALRCST